MSVMVVASTVGTEVAGVTGQTVVPIAMTEVMTRPGQLVTVGAQEVMVKVLVSKIVEVVNS